MRRDFSARRRTALALTGLALCIANGVSANDAKSGLFDSNWRFLRADAPGAEAPGFDDSAWRILDVPHDWSIEDLPPLDKTTVPELPVVDGQWRFQKGDDAAWKAPGFDDGDWQTVTLPDSWEHHSDYTEDNVYGWFRRRIEIPADCKDKDFDLLLGRIDDVDEAFLNGERIGGTGSFPPDFSSDWEADRRYRVPASLVRGDGTDVLAVRVYDGGGGGGIYSAPVKSVRTGPFDSTLSEGGIATGFVVGGTGWYRKHFTLAPSDAGKNATICFDGVYMNADVWLNGHHLGSHPYGYTPFVFDLTPYLNPAGQENVLAVRVRNIGKNSRWYSGSGIYRHVRLTIADPVHIPFFGVHVATLEIAKDVAKVGVATTIENDRDTEVVVQLRARLIGPDGKATKMQEREVRVPAGKSQEFSQEFAVKNPELWSLDDPALYRAEVGVFEKGTLLDRSSAPFGIRTIRFTAEKGFELNGKVVELKGGNMHHDNGPLGAAAIDRAEERRVQLMKEYGYNAIRTSHNPPSPAFLDACDRLGVLVIDEAFDMWEKPKNPDDYHLNFKAWWKRDLESMILRDRNHPSVIMWSIGKEIPERADPPGVALAEELVATIHQLDSTRPATAGVCGYWDRPNSKWTDLDPAFSSLDVGGYNYQLGQYIPDHQRFPERVMYGSETYPHAILDGWRLVEAHPWVIGDFVWTAWDYLGEVGLGGSVLDNEPGSRQYPYFNAFCGDVDLCGFKKAPLYYREVVWGDSSLNLAVHAPIPPGRREVVGLWGWPDERQSWTWPGSEGQPLDVTVYSSCAAVRLELNGKEISSQPVNDRLTARFKVPYQPGELRAVGLSKDGKVVASASLRTAGEPEAIRLTADRPTIRADRNDLSYVTVEIVDGNGTVVPNGAFPVHFSVIGEGELAAQGSGVPNEPASFKLPVRKTWRGRCLAILRPRGNAGKMILKAEADGLKSSTIIVETR